MARKNNKKEQIFYIKGMHCASCKKIIEGQLNEKSEVISAVVDPKAEKLVLSVEKSPSITADKLTDEFSDLGYVFSSDPFNRDLKNIFISTALAFVILFLLLKSEKITMMYSAQINESSSVFAFLILGIVASLSSCVALVGGVILSMTKKWSNTTKSVSGLQKMDSHIKFHFGRLAAYAVGGGLLGIFGGLITFDNSTFFVILILFVSIIMFFIGLQMLGVKSIASIYAKLNNKIFGKFQITGKFHEKSPFAIGAATFFLPCGFTLIAQGAALTSGNFIDGVAVMGAFAIGTTPVLLGISFGSTILLGKKKFASFFNLVIGTVIMVFALYTINGQLNVLGLPSFSDIISSNKNSGNAAVEKIQSSEKKDSQELQVVAKGFEYIIVGSNELEANIPTKLIVDNQGIAGCGAYMAARGLLDDWVKLKPGINEFEFTPKPGAYKITCTMGMVPPISVIVK